MCVGGGGDFHGCGHVCGARVWGGTELAKRNRRRPQMSNSTGCCSEYF